VLATVLWIALTQATPPEPRVERLANGLRVVLVEDHTLPLVSVQVWYRVGSAQDDLRRPGLCHVTRTILEHRDDAALRLRAAGVRFESRTLRDACYFATSLPPDFAEFVLAIEAGRMRPRRATPEAVAQGLVAAARDDTVEPENSEHLAERVLAGALWGEHPYRHPPGFVAETLRDVRPDDVNEFLERWFVPASATIVLVGDISDVATLELIRKLFVELPWAEPPRRAEHPAPKAETIRLAPLASARPGVEIAWLAPPAGDIDHAAIAVLMHRLCNPVDGPLCHRLIDLGGAPPRWRQERFRDGGMLRLSLDFAEAGDSPAAQVERAVREELGKAAETIPSEIEFNRARALAARELRLHRASFQDRALELGWSEVVAGDVLLADFEMVAVSRLRVPDLQHAALELAEARTVILPRAASEPASQSATSKLAVPLRATPPTQLGTDAALALLRRHANGAPPIRSPKSPATIATQTLANGVQLTACIVPGLDFAEVRTILESREGDWESSLGPLMAVGSTRRPVEEIRDYVTYHGLDVFPHLRGVRGGFASRGSVARVPQLIELHAELLRYPNRETGAVQRAAKAGERLTTWLETEHARDLYVPPGFVGWLALRTPESEVDDLQERLRNVPVGQAPRIVVVGRVHPEEVFDAVRAAWGDFVATGSAASQPSGADYLAMSSADIQPTSAPATMARWITARGQTILDINDWLWPSALEPNARLLVAHWDGRLLGAPWAGPAELGIQSCWRWHVARAEPFGVSLRARPLSEDVVTALEEMLDRLERLPLGRLPVEQVSLALRLARVERLLTLDSVAAIADALETDVANPWDILDGIPANELWDWLPQVHRVRYRLITGWGPVDRSAEFKRFERPESQPVTSPRP